MYFAKKGLGWLHPNPFFGKIYFLLISENEFFHKIKRDGIMWRNYKFAWNSCLDVSPFKPLSPSLHLLRCPLIPEQTCQVTRSYPFAPPLHRWAGGVKNRYTPSNSWNWFRQITMKWTAMGSVSAPVQGIHSKKKSTPEHLFLVLQVVTNRGLHSVPGRTKWYLEGPW